MDLNAKFECFMNNSIPLHKQFIDECLNLRPDESMKQFYTKYSKLPKDGRVHQNKETDYRFGYIYTFQYKPLNEDVLSYYDRQPIVFFTNRNKFNKNEKSLVVDGINLNFIPVKIRIYILSVFKQYFDTIYQSGKITDIISSSKSSIESGYWQKMLDYLIGNTILKTNYEFAIRPYCVSPKCMKNLRIIDYEDWNLVATLNEKFIIGKSVSDIYSMYWKFKKSEYKKKIEEEKEAKKQAKLEAKQEKEKEKEAKQQKNSEAESEETD